MRYKRAIEELQKFGVKEVIYHLFSNLTGNMWFKTHMLLEKDKYYRNLDDAGIKKELEQQYAYITKEKIDIEKPANFNQKIQWLKVYDNLPIKQTLADKYAVRKWVADKIGENYLIPLIGVWASFDEIDVSSLPQAFCLKANHGSGMNYIVRNKALVNWNKVKKLVDLWMLCPFYAKTLEPQYKNIKRKIVAEEYIGDRDKTLYDYKIHCFRGEPKFIQTIGDRDATLQTGKVAFYDLNWKRNLHFESEHFAQYADELAKPQNLDEMIQIARVLSEGFEYVRVDLYNLHGEIKFGEMTFTPASGHDKWVRMIPDEWWK